MEFSETAALLAIRPGKNDRRGKDPLRQKRLFGPKDCLALDLLNICVHVRISLSTYMATHREIMCYL